tara:strand:- start:341 stop:757 length:417 start_codon:yes stop_codon:yes gene_type:complete
MCTSFKVALLDGEMDFSSNTSQTFKIALFTSSADLDADTAAYAVTNEASGTGYTAGGATLTISTNPTSTSGTAYLTFSTVSWDTSSITARGALIYRSSGTGNNAIVVLDFGVDKTTLGSTFTVTFPTADNNTAIIRIA